MQARTKSDNRRSGRTTRMLAAAIASVYRGGIAYVVLPRGLWQYAVPILKDLGASYVCPHRRFAEFGADSKIYFKQLSDPDVNPEMFEIRGVRSENIFWDHEAIRQANNRVIQRYHEYD